MNPSNLKLLLLAGLGLPIAVPKQAAAEAASTSIIATRPTGTLALARASYDSDTEIVVDRLILESGGVLRVENGAAWHARATVIEIRGHFLIDGRGTAGAAGSTPEPWTSSGPCTNFGPFGAGDVAHDDWNAAGGHPNDRGTNGGAGRNGANIVIEYERLVFTGVSGHVADLVSFQTTGGAGGEGGRGRTLVCGCHHEEKHGPDGTPGAPGLPGSFALRQIEHRN